MQTLSFTMSTNYKGFCTRLGPCGKSTVNDLCKGYVLVLECTKKNRVAMHFFFGGGGWVFSLES